MPTNTRITPYLTDFSGTTLEYPKDLSLRGFKINLSGTTNNSVPIYDDVNLQYEPVKGTEINDDVQKSFVYPLNNLTERLNTTLYSLANDVAISGTTESSLLGYGVGSKILPPDYFTYSKAIKIEAWGKISSDLVTPGLLNLRYKINNITVAETGNITLVGFTNQTFKLELITTGRFLETVASGTTQTQGLFNFTSAANTAMSYAINSPFLSGATIDNTTYTPLDLTAEFSVSDVDNNLQVTNLLITRYN